MFATVPETIVNPINIASPPALSRLVIDIAGSSPSEAPRTNVTELQVRKQIINRVLLEQTGFPNSRFVLRTAVTEDLRVLGAHSQHSLKRLKQIPMSAQRKTRLGMVSHTENAMGNVSDKMRGVCYFTLRSSRFQRGARAGRWKTFGRKEAVVLADYPCDVRHIATKMN